MDHVTNRLADGAMVRAGCARPGMTEFVLVKSGKDDLRVTRQNLLNRPRHLPSPDYFSVSMVWLRYRFEWLHHVWGPNHSMKLNEVNEMTWINSHHTETIIESWVYGHLLNVLPPVSFTSLTQKSEYEGSHLMLGTNDRHEWCFVWSSWFSNFIPTESNFRSIWSKIPSRLDSVTVIIITQMILKKFSAKVLSHWKDLIEWMTNWKVIILPMFFLCTLLSVDSTGKPWMSAWKRYLEVESREKNYTRRILMAARKMNQRRTREKSIPSVADTHWTLREGETGGKTNFQDEWTVAFYDFNRNILLSNFGKFCSEIWLNLTIRR